MSLPPVFDVAIPLIGFNRSGAVRMVVHVANAIAARRRRVAFVVPAHASVPPLDMRTHVEIIVRGHSRGFSDRVDFVTHLPEASVYVATNYQTPLLIDLARLRSRRYARIVYLIQADEERTEVAYGPQPGWLKPALHLVAKRSLAVPATRIAVSAAVADAVGRRHIQRVINPGIEARYLEQARQATPLRRLRRTDVTDRLTVGFFAQAGRLKGSTVAIDAVSRLSTDSSLRLLALDLPGAPAMPDYIERFSILQAERPVDMMAFYNTCDIFVFPSLIEGFGLPPLEAMACGVPAVISDCGGVREYARNESNCLLVPPGDATAMAAAIQRLVDDPPLRAALADAGRETALRFPVERFASECADEIERFLRDRSVS
ncbi:MAG TPA: glycosyltransferase family 4 protein [Candidatus Krumholzibacteria bacterium]